jgi:hypothetical protein
MNTSPEGNMAPQRGWWSRNWKWVVPVGCLGVLASCGCLGAIAFFAATSAIKSTTAYVQAVQVVMTDPEVQEALGSPIETGMLQGSVKTENDQGSADFTIPLDGPKADGTLRVKATKAGGDWNFHVLQVEVPGRAPIDLVGKLGGGEQPGRALPPGGEQPAAPDQMLPPDEAGEDRMDAEPPQEGEAPQDGKEGSDINL